MAMIAAIRRMLAIFQGGPVTAEALAKIGKTHDFRIALAALLVHAGKVDGAFVEQEKQVVRRLLAEQFAMPPIDASELMILVNYSNLQAAELDEPVAALADCLGDEGRVQFIAWVWQVITADGIVTPEEAELVSRLAEKLGVTPWRSEALAREHRVKPSH